MYTYSERLTTGLPNFCIATFYCCNLCIVTSFSKDISGCLLSYIYPIAYIHNSKSSIMNTFWKNNFHKMCLIIGCTKISMSSNHKASLLTLHINVLFQHMIHSLCAASSLLNIPMTLTHLADFNGKWSYHCRL